MDPVSGDEEKPFIVEDAQQWYGDFDDLILIPNPNPSEMLLNRAPAVVAPLNLPPPPPPEPLTHRRDPYCFAGFHQTLPPHYVPRRRRTPEPSTSRLSLMQPKTTFQYPPSGIAPPENMQLAHAHSQYTPQTWSWTCTSYEPQDLRILKIEPDSQPQPAQALSPLQAFQPRRVIQQQQPSQPLSNSNDLETLQNRTSQHPGTRESSQAPIPQCSQNLQTCVEPHNHRLCPIGVQIQSSQPQQQSTPQKVYATWNTPQPARASQNPELPNTVSTQIVRQPLQNSQDQRFLAQQNAQPSHSAPILEGPPLPKSCCVRIAIATGNNCEYNSDSLGNETGRTSVIHWAPYNPSSPQSFTGCVATNATPYAAKATRKNGGRGRKRQSPYSLHTPQNPAEQREINPQMPKVRRGRGRAPLPELGSIAAAATGAGAPLPTEPKPRGRKRKELPKEPEPEISVEEMTIGLKHMKIEVPDLLPDRQPQPTIQLISETPRPRAKAETETIMVGGSLRYRLASPAPTRINLRRAAPTAPEVGQQSQGHAQGSGQTLTVNYGLNDTARYFLESERRGRQPPEREPGSITATIVRPPSRKMEGYRFPVTIHPIDHRRPAQPQPTPQQWFNQGQQAQFQLPTTSAAAAIMPPPPSNGESSFLAESRWTRQNVDVNDQQCAQESNEINYQNQVCLVERQHWNSVSTPSSSAASNLMPQEQQFQVQLQQHQILRQRLQQKQQHLSMHYGVVSQFEQGQCRPPHQYEQQLTQHQQLPPRLQRRPSSYAVLGVSATNSTAHEERQLGVQQRQQQQVQTQQQQLQLQSMPHFGVSQFELRQLASNQHQEQQLMHPHQQQLIHQQELMHQQKSMPRLQLTQQQQQQQQKSIQFHEPCNSLLINKQFDRVVFKMPGGPLYMFTCKTCRRNCLSEADMVDHLNGSEKCNFLPTEQ